ncbi:hypothetical protein M3172_08645 [Mesobacillus subterraneus]|uniref:hypothetical protein n=1 Tax=Mesobacillus subterraneus TaxID=285983 RepID=UPI00203E1AC5|nr:hypothetical protein [Mesobacillus subterraneus]MCM3573261.1 hypothetical protein [Mesobacillus subterraneus]
MAEKNRFSKPVAFNNKNEVDKKILKHVSRRNFSGYVKKLILEDIKAKELAKGAILGNEEETENTITNNEPNLSVTERLEQLKKAGNPARSTNKNVN